jgi:hypothetical protein
MLVIPRAPRRLRLPIERHWHGEESKEVRGSVELSQVGASLELRAELRQRRPLRAPELPSGTRCDGLWNYDVVECFLAGAGGRYLEIEIDSQAHWLVLGFRARRVRSSEFSELRLSVSRGLRADAAWWATLRLPLALLPRGLRSINAFAIASGHFLAYHPLPGPAADFHQPDRWPAARLAR